jgi:hypothetical protein
VTARSRLPVAAALALALVPAWAGIAPAATVSVRAEIRVPPLQSLETTPGIVDLAPVTIDDLERGFLDVPEPVELTISSNVPWELFARRTDPSGPAVEGSLEHGPFRAIGMSWSSLATGEGGADHAVLSLRLRLAVGWTTAVPGDHGLRLEYRLAPRGS